MAAVTISDTVEGTVNEAVWFHFDLSNDVLHLRFIPTRNLRVFGEETDDGFTAFYTEDDKFAGMTILSFWERFGNGKLSSASQDELRSKVEQFTREHFLNRQK